MASKHQNKIKKEWESKGWWVIKLIRCGENGLPDLICLKDGEAVFIESKEVNDKPSPTQLFKIKKLNSFGFQAFISQAEK